MTSKTYADDYERLVQLAPSSGKAETLGGEIMRAVKVVSKAQLTNHGGQETNSLEALNFLTKFGVISKDENNLYAKLASLDDKNNKTEPTDEMELALDTLVDRAIAIILANPDLEFVENEDGFVGCDPDPCVTKTKTRKSTRKQVPKASLKNY
jgi:hypothetical protein